jgi:hypothetical protein
MRMCLQDEGLSVPAAKQQPAKGSKAGRKQQAGSSRAAAAVEVEQELFCSAFGYGECGEVWKSRCLMR